MIKSATLRAYRALTSQQQQQHKVIKTPQSKSFVLKYLL